MKILVTGANGQLGSELKALAPQNKIHSFVFTDVGELDITDLAAVDAFMKEGKFDALVNCAAYTAVDKAESEKSRAYLINAVAVKNLAVTAKKYKVFPVHISTDFVFDGRKSEPYLENDKTAPLSVYGVTKLDGEKFFLKNVSEGAIIRTGWLYSSYGNNFAKTVLRLAREKGKIGMIFDQTGTPTYAHDLARAVLEILPKVKRGKKEIYNYSNEGVASWYDFAKAVCEMAAIACIIQPIVTAEYPTPARRPRYSVLNKAKIKKEFSIEIPYWRDSLKLCVARLKGK